MQKVILYSTLKEPREALKSQLEETELANLGKRLKHYKRLHGHFTEALFSVSN